MEKNCHNCDFLIYDEKDFFTVSCKKNMFKHIDIGYINKYSEKCKHFDDSIHIKFEKEANDAMQEYYEYLKQEEDKKEQFLKELKKSISDDLYNDILNELYESEKTDSYEIVDYYHGEFVETSNNKELKGYYVNQYIDGGMTSDTYEGDVYIKIDNNKYFKYTYNM